MLQKMYLSDPHQLVDASERFSGAIMIINLPVRLISCKYLLKIGQARNGSLATLFPPGPGEFVLYLFTGII